MSRISLASWNVNGIRACCKNGFIEWLNSSQPHIVLLQETRADASQVPPELANFARYQQVWQSSTVKKGYSGTAILSKDAPLRIFQGMDRHEFDGEGRVLAAEFKDLIVVSAYFPNSQDGGKRLSFKLSFCEAIHDWCRKLRSAGKVVVLSGDFNIAPQPIDLARPDDNENSPGYLPEEREWMQSFLDSGWVDTFRYLHPETIKYSWWSQRTRARERNIGWRLDFHTVDIRDKGAVLRAGIEDEVLGSDHCPVTLLLEL